jgi:hypothetical protein
LLSYFRDSTLAGDGEKHKKAQVRTCGAFIQKAKQERKLTLAVFEAETPYVKLRHISSVLIELIARRP